MVNIIRGAFLRIENYPSIFQQDLSKALKTKIAYSIGINRLAYCTSPSSTFPNTHQIKPVNHSNKWFKYVAGFIVAILGGALYVEEENRKSLDQKIHYLELQNVELNKAKEWAEFLSSQTEAYRTKINDTLVKIKADHSCDPGDTESIFSDFANDSIEKKLQVFQVFLEAYVLRSTRDLSIYEQFKNFFKNNDSELISELIHKNLATCQNYPEASFQRCCALLMIQMVFLPHENVYFFHSDMFSLFSNIPFESVETAIKSCLQSINFFNAPPSFFEIILHSHWAGQSRSLISYVDQGNFSLGLMKAISTTSFQEWSKKESVIRILFSRETSSQRLKLASAMQKAEDKETRILGEYFINALNAQSFSEKLPYLNKIAQMLPKMSEAEFEQIFKHPFPKFEKEQYYSSTSKTVRIMNLNSSSTINDQIIVGLTGYKQGYRESCLTAYNLSDETLLWSIPLRDKNLKSYNVSSGGIAFTYTDSHLLDIIDAETGEKKASIVLPEAALYLDNCQVHLTSNGVCYYITESGQLRVGNTQNGAWEEIANLYPAGLRLKAHGDLISTVGREGDNHLFCNPEGKTFRLFRKQAVEFQNGMLYVAERAYSPSEVVITTQNIDSEKFMPGESKEVVRIPVGNFSSPLFSFKFEGIAEGGKSCVCVLHKGYSKAIYSVNLENQTVKTLGDSKISEFAQIAFDPKRNVVWTMDYNELLKRHSERGTETFEHVKSASFLGFDKEGRPLIS